MSERKTKQMKQKRDRDEKAPVNMEEKRASSTLIAKLPLSFPASTSLAPLRCFGANRPEATGHKMNTLQ